jgi:hypothetical protein
VKTSNLAFFLTTGVNSLIFSLWPFRYFLEDTETNSRAYIEKQHITASDEVLQLVAAARELKEKFTSKI